MASRGDDVGDIGRRHFWIVATSASDGALAASSLALVCRGVGHERILKKRRHHESHHQPGSRIPASHNGQLGQDLQEGDGEIRPHTSKLCQGARKSNADHEESRMEQPNHGLGTAQEKLLDFRTIVEASLVSSPQLRSSQTPPGLLLKRITKKALR